MMRTKKGTPPPAFRTAFNKIAKIHNRIRWAQRKWNMHLAHHLKISGPDSKAQHAPSTETTSRLLPAQRHFLFLQNFMDSLNARALAVHQHLKSPSLPDDYAESIPLENVFTGLRFRPTGLETADVTAGRLFRAAERRLCDDERDIAWWEERVSKRIDCLAKWAERCHRRWQRSAREGRWKVTPAHHEEMRKLYFWLRKVRVEVGPRQSEVREFFWAVGTKPGSGFEAERKRVRDEGKRDMRVERGMKVIRRRVRECIERRPVRQVEITRFFPRVEVKKRKVAVRPIERVQKKMTDFYTRDPSRDPAVTGDLGMSELGPCGGPTASSEIMKISNLLT